MIKKTAQTIFDVALTGVAMQSIGNVFTGSMRGIGDATQSILGVGLLGRTWERFLK